MSVRVFPKTQIGGERRSRIRTSSVQRGQLRRGENRNLLIVKLVPIVIVVIDRLLVGLGSLAGFGMENALLSKSDVVAGICRGTLVCDNRYPTIVRASEDREDRARKTLGCLTRTDQLVQSCWAGSHITLDVRTDQRFELR